MKRNRCHNMGMARPGRLLRVLIVTLAAECSDGTAPEPQAEPGRMNIVVTGAVQDSFDWQASGQFMENLDGLGRISTLGARSDSSAATPDFELFIPLQLKEGKYRIDGVVSYGRIANASIDLDGRRFSSIDGGTLIVRSADYPPRPGLEPGMLRGTMSFKAVEAVLAPVDTITVTATFAALWYHDLMGSVSIEFTGGGPALGHTVSNSEPGAAGDGHGGLLLSWNGAFYDPSNVAGVSVTQDVRLAAPSVNVFFLANITPSIRASPASWPAVFSQVSYQGQPIVALSTGGTLTITRVIPATARYYGQIWGSLSGRLALWSDDTTVTADTVQAVVTFAVPVWPENGLATR